MVWIPEDDAPEELKQLYEYLMSHFEVRERQLALREANLCKREAALDIVAQNLAQRR